MSPGRDPRAAFQRSPIIGSRRKATGSVGSGLHGGWHTPGSEICEIAGGLDDKIRVARVISGGFSPEPLRR